MNVWFIYLKIEYSLNRRSIHCIIARLLFALTYKMKIHFLHGIENFAALGIHVLFRFTALYYATSDVCTHKMSIIH